jgi:hypothetical protein
MENILDNNSDPNDIEIDENPLFLRVKEVFPKLEKHISGLPPLVYEYVQFLVDEVLGGCNDKNFYLRCLESVKIFYGGPQKRTHIGSLTNNIQEEKMELVIKIASVLSEMGDEIGGVPSEDEDSGKGVREKIKENLES